MATNLGPCRRSPVIAPRRSYLDPRSSTKRKGVDDSAAVSLIDQNVVQFGAKAMRKPV
jgi:hypothetical protein